MEASKSCVRKKSCVKFTSFASLELRFNNLLFTSVALISVALRFFCESWKNSYPFITVNTSTLKLKSVWLQYCNSFGPHRRNKHATHPLLGETMYSFS